ncbi:MAG: flippase-like domain-containing protein [Planctomycetes bacterium]|nr:flippase-like domain-containing protein [Planctomycetota bacterium]
MNNSAKMLNKWLLRSVGPLILLFILFRLDVGATIDVIRRTSVWPLVVAYLMFVPSLLFRTQRWAVLIAALGIRMGFWESFNVYAFSTFTGIATPGRLGEFIKAFYLKRKGSSLGLSLFSVFLDRLCDILFLLISGCGALFVIAEFDDGPAATIAFTLLGVMLGVVVLLVVTRGKGNKTAIRVLRTVSPPSLRGRMTIVYQDFCSGFRKTKLKALGVVFLLTALAWGMNYWAVFLVGRALGFDIAFFGMACIAAICALVTLMPVSVMGLGTRDAASILMLGNYGISEAGAVAFSTLILSMILFNAVICSFSLLSPAVRFDWRSEMDEILDHHSDDR